MSEEKKASPVKSGGNTAKMNTQPNAKPVNNANRGKSVYAQKKRFGKAKRGNFKKDKPKDEFEQRIVDIARVTRVMAGGKRMRFRACVAIGDKKGRVAVGLSKGADVTMAVTKAVNKAKKAIINVPIINDTIPHEIYKKVGAAKILLKPARKGKGVIAGGAARIILELAGVHNITSKILGTNNKVNISRSVIEALDSLKKIEKKSPSAKATEDKAKKNNKPASAKATAWQEK